MGKRRRRISDLYTKTELYFIIYCVITQLIKKMKIRHTHSSTHATIISDSWLCVGTWICWASCSSHCTFNYSRPQITSRIRASMSRLPPPHVNTLLLLMLPSHFHSLPLLWLFFFVSVVKCWTISCPRATCFLFLCRYFLIFTAEMRWKIHKRRKNPQSSDFMSLNTHC